MSHEADRIALIDRGCGSEQGGRRLRMPNRRLAMPNPRRLLAPIGGTLTLSDCMAALGFLADFPRLVKGPTITEYEEAFARMIGVRHAYSFASGRLGLYGLLKILGVGHGDEVLVQVPTHVVVPNAIRYTGARPVYVDCCPSTYNMNLEEAERRVTPATKVLLLQHTFGIPVDMDAARELADRYGLVVIEDCAHALGAKYDGRHVGTFGKAAFFSTEEKTITSAMGGVVVTNDSQIAQEIEAFRSMCEWPSPVLVARYMLKLVVFHLLTQPYLHKYLRFIYKLLRSRYIAPGATSVYEERGERPNNYQQRLSNAQAGIALRQLRRLEQNLNHRRRIANAYRSNLASQGVAGPQVPANGEAAFSRYPVRVADRGAAMQAANGRAVLGQWLSAVIDGAVPPADSDYERGSCPQAETLVQQLVNLPTHPRVTVTDAEIIAWSLEGCALTEADEANRCS